MIIAKIIMNALPEKRKEVFQTLLSMIEAIRQEKGCRSCQVFRDIEDENVFNLVQEWETREDMEHHMRSDRFGVLLGTNNLLKEQQNIQIHTISHSEGMEVVHAARGKRIGSGFIMGYWKSALYPYGFTKFLEGEGTYKVEAILKKTKELGKLITNERIIQNNMGSISFQQRDVHVYEHKDE